MKIFKAYAIKPWEPRYESSAKILYAFLKCAHNPEVAFLHDEGSCEIYHKIPSVSKLQSMLEKNSGPLLATVSSDESDIHRMQLMVLPPKDEGPFQTGETIMLKVHSEGCADAAQAFLKHIDNLAQEEN